MASNGKRLLATLVVGVILTVSAGTIMAIVAAAEEQSATARWRQEMDSRYGPGAVGEPRGSEYSLVGAIAINSILAGVVIDQPLDR